MHCHGHVIPGYAGNVPDARAACGGFLVGEEWVLMETHSGALGQTASVGRIPQKSAKEKNYREQHQDLHQCRDIDSCLF